jgi:hypothetical protein
MKRSITALAALGLLAAAAPAAEARTVAYKGKTSGGSTITLKRSGKKVSRLRTVVPTTCVETTGSGLSRAGVELYRPPGRARLGKPRRVKALQPAAMNSGIKATKTYRISLRRSGRKVKGRLRVSFSFLRPDLFRSLPYIYLCTGSTRFSAKPR